MGSQWLYLFLGCLFIVCLLIVQGPFTPGLNLLSQLSCQFFVLSTSCLFISCLSISCPVYFLSVYLLCCLFNVWFQHWRKLCLLDVSISCLVYYLPCPIIVLSIDCLSIVCLSINRLSTCWLSRLCQCADPDDTYFERKT